MLARDLLPSRRRLLLVIQHRPRSCQPFLLQQHRSPPSLSVPALYSMAANLAVNVALQQLHGRLSTRPSPDPQGFGNLRCMLKKLPMLREMVLEHVATVLKKMVRHTIDENRREGCYTSWDKLWKPKTQKGYDVINNKVIDYGNVEYSALLAAFCAMHDDIAHSMAELAEFWPTLVFPPMNDRGASMQGDVIEIVLAAFRADELFINEIRAHAGADVVDFPSLLQALCDVCRTVHWLHAYSVSGKVKYSQVHVRKHLGELLFADMWRDLGTRAILLEALMRSPVALNVRQNVEAGLA